MHADQRRLSSLHRNVAAVSVDENRKVAVDDEVEPLGPAVIAVSGGRSTRHDQLAGVGSTFPARSLARARITCLPSDSPDTWPHSPQPWLSRRHSKVAPDSLETEKVAVPLCETCGGPFSMAVSGGFVSTVHLWLTGDGSEFPAPSSPSSSLHSKDECFSLEANSKRSPPLEKSFGASVSFVAGALASTSHSRVAGVGSLLPAPSTARTRKECLPRASPV